MARTAKETPRWKLPKTLPEGVSIQTQGRTLGTKPKDWTEESANTDDYGKDIPVSVLSVHNNAGVVFVQELMDKHGGEGTGEAFLVNAVNSALASVATDLTPKTAGESLTIMPTASAPRYVDKAQLIADSITADLKAGKKLTAAEIAARYADVIA